MSPAVTEDCRKISITHSVTHVCPALPLLALQLCRACDCGFWAVPAHLDPRNSRCPAGALTTSARRHVKTGWCLTRGTYYYGGTGTEQPDGDRKGRIHSNGAIRWRAAPLIVSW